MLYDQFEFVKSSVVYMTLSAALMPVDDPKNNFAINLGTLKEKKKKNQKCYANNRSSKLNCLFFLVRNNRYHVSHP